MDLHYVVNEAIISRAYVIRYLPFTSLQEV